MNKVTFCFVQGKPANVQFIWDEVGPGLQVVWSEQADLVGQVVRSDASKRLIVDGDTRSNSITCHTRDVDGRT